MRGQTSTVHCDFNDGMCGNWDMDYYEATASSVDGVPITRDQRAPGWTSTNDDHDYCPKHSGEVTDERT